MLASAAQDYFIRIWRFSQRTVEDNIVKSVKELSLDEEIKMRENTFQFKIGGQLQFSNTYMEFQVLKNGQQKNI